MTRRDRGYATGGSDLQDLIDACGATDQLARCSKPKDHEGPHAGTGPQGFRFWPTAVAQADVIGRRHLPCHGLTVKISAQDVERDEIRRRCSTCRTDWIGRIKPGNDHLVAILGRPVKTIEWERATK